MLEIKETRRNAMLKIKRLVFTLVGAALLLASSRALAVDGDAYSNNLFSNNGQGAVAPNGCVQTGGNVCDGQLYP